MKPKDTALYETLRVSPRAKYSAIKAAYRKCAARTHPDVGGDAEEFMRAREAWEVLGHSERRREYDRTGRWNKVIVVNSRQMLHNFMANLFNVVIDQGVAFDRTAPLIDLMKRACKENGDRFAEDVKKARGFVASLEDLDERITRKGDGDNVFSKMLDERLRGARSKLKEHEVNFEAARDCFKELDLYESVDEVVRTMQTFRVFSGADTGTTTSTY